MGMTGCTTCGKNVAENTDGATYCSVRCAADDGVDVTTGVYTE